MVERERWVEISIEMPGTRFSVIRDEILCRRIAEQEARIEELRSLVADLADELEPKIRDDYATSVPGDMTPLRQAMLDDDLEVVSRARKALGGARG